MRYTLVDIYNASIELEEYTTKNLYDGQIEIGNDTVQLSSPADGATAVTTTPTLQWVDFPEASKYVVRVWDYTGDVKVSEIIQAYTSASEYTVPTALQGATKYLWQVTVATLDNQPITVTDEITGITISPGSTIQEDGSRVFTISTTGTGNYSTAYTPSAPSGGFTFSQSGDQLTVTEVGGVVDDTKSFTVTSDEDGAITDSRTLTVVTAGYTPVDTVQGDFEALTALYDATQGQDFPTLNDSNNLPTSSTAATYPYAYMINGDLWYAEIERKGEFADGNEGNPLSWVNAGAPWTVKTGWDTMTAQTMGDAYGVTTNADGRVTRLDLQKLNTELVNGVYLTSGNVVAGQMPEEIGNLQQLEYLNIKQNFFINDIPSSITNLSKAVRLSLAGSTWDMKIDEDNRRQWHESDHRTGFSTITIVDGLAVGSDNAGLGKKIMATNRFRSDIPDISGLQSLELFELRHQYLTGTIPSFSNLPAIRAVLFDNTRDAGAETISGSIPSSFGGLTTMVVFQCANYHTNPRFSGDLPASMEDWVNLANIDVGDNSFTGSILEFPLSRDKRYVRFSNNSFTGGFPSNYFNGDNSLMTKWQIGSNNLTGALPTTITTPVFPTERTNYAVDAPGIGGNGFTGDVPDWFQTMLGLQTFYIAENEFESFPDKVMEQGNLKTFYINLNNISGTLPDKSWGPRRIGWHYGYSNNLSGSIPEKWRSLVLVDGGYAWDESRVDLGGARYDTSIGTSGTLTWDAITGAVYYEVFVKDANDDNLYVESGITGTSLNVSGLSEPPTTFIVKGYNWSGSNEFTGTGATLTWDAVAGADGYQVDIYNASNNLVLRECWMINETLTVSGLTSADYYWRVRGMSYLNDMRFSWGGNQLSGVIPDWFGAFSSGGVNLSNNRFSFKDIGPNYTAIKAAHGTAYAIGNQKPFGTSQNETVSTGGNISLDLSEFAYTNNVYQWLKGGNAISDGGQYSGTTTDTLTITGVSSGDAGEYTLQVTNADYPDVGTQVSQPIQLQVT